MTTSPAGPSVVEIVRELSRIENAIHDADPAPEWVDFGTDRAVAREVWLPRSDSELGAANVPPIELDAEAPILGQLDTPNVVFEVPPHVTNEDVRNVLGKEGWAEIERLAQIRGVDALGWYISFHQRRHQYGIHIPAKGILYLALQLYERGVRDAPLGRLCELAFRAILRHELFHFEVDCMVGNWELVTGEPIFWAARSKLRNGEGYIEEEEGLANAYMLRAFQHPKKALRVSGSYKALRAFCWHQPLGYRDGPWIVRNSSRYLGRCGELSENYLSVLPSRRISLAFDHLLMYNDPLSIDWTRCPIMIVDEEDILGILGFDVAYFQAISAIRETEGFRRQLKKLDPSVCAKWNKTKAKLAVSTQISGLDFKIWRRGGGYYSVRLDKGYRAHLRFDKPSRTWFAEEVGSHKAMGHG